jgi:hypothetical protein
LKFKWVFRQLFVGSAVAADVNSITTQIKVEISKKEGGIGLGMYVCMSVSVRAYTLEEITGLSLLCMPNVAIQLTF